jgi:ethanolamine ammonia-lyase small subunit
VAEIVQSNLWRQLRQFTPARIALGRVGSSLPTDEVLRFGLAHALAQDAVHLPLDVAALDTALRAARWRTLRLHSRAADRATYLLRPDYGRRLNDVSAAALIANTDKSCDLVFVVADGLSALAVERHTVPLLEAMRPLLKDAWSVGPIVIVGQGRVAIGDEIGELMRARMTIVLIGERPGLSSPDSLGIYLTFAPKLGRTDAERNCISNIRPEGLSYAAAAKQLVWLLNEANRLRLTGVGLKDHSELRPVQVNPDAASFNLSSQRSRTQT